ncbi:MAG: HAMP domain-containing sensor histidine kinase [Actinomycetota bacterium]
MSFRTRVALLTSVTVALVVGVLAALAYAFVRTELHAQVDGTLLSTVAELQREERSEADDEVAKDGLPSISVPSRLGTAGGYVQLVSADGRISAPAGATLTLPVTDDARAVAARGGPPVFQDRTVAGIPLRVVSAPYSPGVAVQVATPVDVLARTLDRLRWATAGAAGAGVLLAAGLGWLIATTAVRPVRRLTVAAERVTRTHDLGERIDAPGRDELGRLAGAFNAMLQALDEAATAQRRLVADASHELRTPLTSLRTNVEVLAAAVETLPAEERAAILRDVREQAGELGDLMNAVIELARGDAPAPATGPVAVHEVLGTALARVRRDWPATRFVDRVAPWTVLGDADRLERALVNVLGNAAKFGPPGGEVTVDLAGGVLTVRDHGPGIPPAERGAVFERFYRSRSARDTPGSGLGLAIARQVIEAHGGRIGADGPPDGGTVIRIDLSAAPRPPAGAVPDLAGTRPGPPPGKPQETFRSA